MSDLQFSPEEQHELDRFVAKLHHASPDDIRVVSDGLKSVIAYIQAMIAACERELERQQGQQSAEAKS